MPPDRLDQIDLALARFESDAGRLLNSRLASRGPAPFSLCEAQLTEAEYAHLVKWASEVKPNQLSDAEHYGAMLLTAFIAEQNRRHSAGDTVFDGLPPCFKHAPTRSWLFNGKDPRPTLRDAIRNSARRFHLRHVFDESGDEAQRWYITVQLQYGFSATQLLTRLPDWLSGHPVTEAMERLLEREGRYRSRSFQKFLDDLDYYRRDYITRSQVEETVRTSPWRPPSLSVNQIVEAACQAANSLPPRPKVVPDFDILSNPRIEWDERGPVAICRVGDLANLGPRGGRYHLFQEDRLLNSWFRQPGAIVRFASDRTEVELSLSQPQVVVRLEDAAGECCLVQTLTLWDPAAELQVYPLGRTGKPVTALQQGGSYVLMARDSHNVDPAGLEWQRTGLDAVRRRWWLLDPLPESLQVRDEEGQVLWRGQVHPVLPKWAEALLANWGPAGQQFFEFGGDMHFRLDPGPGAYIEYVRCNGQPLEFTSPEKTRTNDISVTPELKNCRLRVGMRGPSGLVACPRELTVPIRGVTVARPNWQILDIDERISVYDAATRSFQVFTEGPNALLEGHVVHQRLESRPRPLGRLLGTGGRLRLVNQPCSPNTQFDIAGCAIDRGLVRGLECIALPRSYRLELVRPLRPAAGHELILWSATQGVARINVADLALQNDGRTWLFDTPWEQDPEPFLCAIAYEGCWLGGDWKGRLHTLLAPDAKGAGPTLLQRLALARWFHLPGLMVDPPRHPRPSLERLSLDAPADLVRVALFDQGLAGLPNGLALSFDESAAQREGFDAIVRELLFDFSLTTEQASATLSLFPTLNELVTRLMAYHPLLAAKVLRDGLLANVPVSQRQLARGLLRTLRLTAAGLTDDASNYQYRRGMDLLLEKARGTLSEQGKPLNANSVDEGMVRPAVAVALHGDIYHDRQRHDVLVALGSAAFRHYLGLCLLERLETP